MTIGRKVRRVLFGIACVAILGYGGVIAWFTLHERDLLFFPEKTLETSPDKLGIVYGRVEIPSTGNVTLVAWIIPSADTSTVWLLYLHGNAGNIAKQGYVEHYAQLHRLGLNILAIDYRGFGESSGFPSERGLYDDAKAGFEYLRARQHVPADRIIVYGYSLGSAVAVNLVSTVPCMGLILEGSFTSITDVGAAHYPLIPVRWMIPDRFASSRRIVSIAVPKLFIHAADDQTVPVALGKELFGIAREPKMFLEVKGGHENAHTVDARMFYGGIQMFLAHVQTLTKN